MEKYYLREAWARAVAERSEKISRPGEAIPHFARWRNKRREHVIALSLTVQNTVIKARVISVGIANQSLVHPREVFRGAILDNAAAIIVGHNHPSGNTTLSPEDHKVFRTLKAAGEILGIPVLDFIAFSSTGYSSALEDES